MKRQVFTTGTIACSAMVLYGLAQTSASEPNPQGCGDTSRTVTTAKQAGTEKQCLQKATLTPFKNVPENFLNLQWGKLGSERLPNNMETVYKDLLEHAQTLAGRDQFVQAVNSVAGIPKNSRHYEMAQQLEEDWSRELLQRADASYQQAKMGTAIATLEAVPSTSQLRDRVVELRQRWSKEDALLKQAIAAKNAGNWQGAIDAVKALEGSPLFNSMPVQQLLQTAMNRLYEPDRDMLSIAMADLPAIPASVAAPETIPTLLDVSRQ